MMEVERSNILANILIGIYIIIFVIIKIKINYIFCVINMTLYIVFL